MSAADVARRLADRLDESGLAYAIGGRTPIDIFISRHPHFREMERRKQGVKDPDGALRWFVSPEDLAVLKLFYARAKDATDLERLFAVRDTLDLDYIRVWLGKMVPAGDPRHDLLEDLAARFGRA